LTVAGDTMSYQACPDCSRKLVRVDSGELECDKCGKEAKRSIERYLLHLEAREGLVIMGMTAFDTVGRALFEKSADKLFEYDPENENEVSYEDAIDSIRKFIYTIKCSAKKVQFKDVLKAEFQICDILGKEEIEDSATSSDETVDDDAIFV
jgi:uncharacterized Zn finger protein (UPF0148 family)